MSDLQRNHNAQKMIEEVKKKLANWNERSQFTIKGIRNLSRSDLDSIMMYGKAIITYGNYNCYMAPRGEIHDVLAAYGLAPKVGEEF